MTTKKLGALWKPKNPKENSPVATGTAEFIVGQPVKIAIFKNQNKKKDNQPDYNLVISENSENKKQESQQSDL
ncbi:MAG: hypothetical protein ACOCUD_01630 [Bacillota bacterium]